MSERDEKRGGSGCAIAGVVLMFLVAPVLYVLSIGPAAMVVNHNDSVQWISVVYYPLELLGESCQPFDEGIRWYIRLWMG
jgi:hypothetical protein